MTQVWPEDDGPDYDVTVAEGYCPDCDGECEMWEDDGAAADED